MNEREWMYEWKIIKSCEGNCEKTKKQQKIKNKRKLKNKKKCYSHINTLYITATLQTNTNTVNPPSYSITCNIFTKNTTSYWQMRVRSLYKGWRQCFLLKTTMFCIPDISKTNSDNPEIEPETSTVGKKWEETVLYYKYLCWKILIYLWAKQLCPHQIKEKIYSF
jgi:hypothetical protein